MRIKPMKPEVQPQTALESSCVADGRQLAFAQWWPAAEGKTTYAVRFTLSPVDVARVRRSVPFEIDANNPAAGAMLEVYQGCEPTPFRAGSCKPASQYKLTNLAITVTNGRLIAGNRITGEVSYVQGVFDPVGRAIAKFDNAVVVPKEGETCQ
jgi:hypothetical protein